MLTLILSVLFVFSLVLYFLKTHYEYWEKRGVLGPKPTLVAGNIGESFLMKKSPFDIFANIYKEYKKFPLVGIFRGTVPALLICDPELIKDMTVKSFANFHDNDIDIDKKLDPIFGRNPFCLKGEEWKLVRSQLTPGFTSGKMKWIYPLLEESGQKMVTFLENEADAVNGNGYEAKLLCSKFTLNNVASCAFGVEAEAFDNDDSEFRQISKQFFQVGFFDTILFFIVFIFPSFTKLFPLKFVNKETEDRLTNLVAKTLKYREENNIVRNDFLHILNQLKKTCKEYEFTDVDVTAHASGFFIDGYETSASVMSFVLYQLAANPDVQSELRQELDDASNDNGDQLPYDILQGLPYLDAVISETLRLHPPLFSLGKVCTKPYTYVPKKGDGITRPVTVEKGTSIVIPLSGLHYDPEYFEEPEVFKPGRFLGSSKDKIVKYTYMPFGEGPRACLGQRFGLLQIKTGLAYIVKNFELSLNAKTKVPLKYDPFAFIITPVGGLWIDYKKIG